MSSCNRQYASSEGTGGTCDNVQKSVWLNCSKGIGGLITRETSWRRLFGRSWCVLCTLRNDCVGAAFVSGWLLSFYTASPWISGVLPQSFWSNKPRKRRVIPSIKSITLITLLQTMAWHPYTTTFWRQNIFFPFSLDWYESRVCLPGPHAQRCRVTAFCPHDKVFLSCGGWRIHPKSWALPQFSSNPCVVFSPLSGARTHAAYVPSTSGPALLVTTYYHSWHAPMCRAYSSANQMRAVLLCLSFI